MQKEQKIETKTIDMRSAELTIPGKIVVVALLGGILSLYASVGLLVRADRQTAVIRDDVRQIREYLKQANERIEQYIARSSLSTMNDLQELDNIDED